MQAENCVERPGECLYDCHNLEGYCIYDGCSLCSMYQKEEGCRCTQMLNTLEVTRQRCPYWTVRRK